MQLIIVRHGHAESLYADLSDQDRQLTSIGIAQAQNTARLVTQEFTPDLLIVSPYIRAQQTMAEFEKICKKQAIECKLITPEDNAELALDALCDLAEQHNAKCVLVVSHMSLVGRLHATLTDEYPIAFETAQARVYEQLVIAPGLSSFIKSIEG